MTYCRMIQSIDEYAKKNSQQINKNKMKIKHKNKVEIEKPEKFTIKWDKAQVQKRKRKENTIKKMDEEKNLAIKTNSIWIQ